MKKLLLPCFILLLLAGCGTSQQRENPDQPSQQEKVFLGDESVSHETYEQLKTLRPEDLTGISALFTMEGDITTDIHMYKVDCCDLWRRWEGYYVFYEGETPRGLVTIRNQKRLTFGAKRSDGNNDIYIQTFKDGQGDLYKNFILIATGVSHFVVSPDGNNVYTEHTTRHEEDKRDVEVRKNNQFLFSWDFGGVRNWGTNFRLYDTTDEELIYGVQTCSGYVPAQYTIWKGEKEITTLELEDECMDLTYTLLIKYANGHLFQGRTDKSSYFQDYSTQRLFDDANGNPQVRENLEKNIQPQLLAIRHFYRLLDQHKFSEAYALADTQMTLEEFTQKRENQTLVVVDGIAIKELYTKVIDDSTNEITPEEIKNLNLFEVALMVRTATGEQQVQYETLQVLNNSFIKVLSHTTTKELIAYPIGENPKASILWLYYKLIANHRFEEAYEMQYTHSKSIEAFSQEYQDIIGVRFLDITPHFEGTTTGEVQAIIELIDSNHQGERYLVEKEIIDGKIKHLASKKTIQRAVFPCEWCGEKPVIYLYPEKETEIQVWLRLNGNLTVTYPEISPEGQREVTAQPDGTLQNKADGKEYSYLFREGQMNEPREITEGFVVKNKDTVAFLQEKLAYLGLTPREYNEFIVYRRPLMKQNKRNLISFIGEAYTRQAPLLITPKPDSMQRVFMVFQGLNEPIEIPEQTLEPFERSGFSVIEWWGSEIT